MYVCVYVCMYMCVYIYTHICCLLAACWLPAAGPLTYAACWLLAAGGWLQKQLKQREQQKQQKQQEQQEQQKQHRQQRQQKQQPAAGCWLLRLAGLPEAGRHSAKRGGAGRAETPDQATHWQHLWTFPTSCAWSFCLHKEQSSTAGHPPAVCPQMDFVIMDLDF